MLQTFSENILENILENIPGDIIIYIAKFLINNSKKNWMSITKRHRYLFYTVFLKNYTVDIQDYYKFSKTNQQYIKKVSNITKILKYTNRLAYYINNYLYEYRVIYDNNTLTHISFDDNYSNKLPTLSSSVISVAFGKYYNLLLEESNLPDTLQHLKIGRLYKQPITWLPSNLVKLEFDIYGIYNFQLPILPETLKYLRLPDSYNFPIDNLPVR